MTPDQVLALSVCVYIGFISLVALLSIWNHTWAWMNDSPKAKYNQILKYFFDEYSIRQGIGDCYAALLMVPIIVIPVAIFFCYYLWPLAILGSICTVMAHLGRASIRLKKKLDTHVEDKSIHNSTNK